MMGGMIMNCWFCSIREADPEHLFHVEMYGDVDTKKTPSQTKVAYNVRHIDVPRCADCHSRHVVALYAAVIAAVLLVALVIAVLFAVFSWAPQWVWGLWAGLAFGLALGTLAIRFFALKGIYSVRQAKAIYPEIKDLLDKCYRFGRRPRGQLPESDEPCASPESSDSSDNPQ